MYLRLLLFAALVAGSLSMSAQTPGVDPELAMLYQQAEQAMSQKDYQRAEGIYIQAIRLSPSNPNPRKDLAYTYFLQGKFKEGSEIIKPVLASSAADEETYQIAAGLEAAAGSTKRSKRIINEGLAKYPNSGILYNALGNNLVQSKNVKEALRAYLKGISKNEQYPVNYYNAAKLLSERNQYVWALFYAEIYINLDPSSAKSIEMRQLMAATYRSLFSSPEGKELPKFRAGASASQASSFTGRFTAVINNNLTTLADGFTTENITMLRTRILLDWDARFGVAAHSLLAYQQKLALAGQFDAYNQWLLGAALDSQNYAQWTAANREDYVSFEQYMKINTYRPLPTDPQYNQ